MYQAASETEPNKEPSQKLNCFCLTYSLESKTKNGGGTSSLSNPQATRKMHGNIIPPAQQRKTEKKNFAAINQKLAH